MSRLPTRTQGRPQPQPQPALQSLTQNSHMGATLKNDGRQKKRKCVRPSGRLSEGWSQQIEQTAYTDPRTAPTSASTCSPEPYTELTYGSNAKERWKTKKKKVCAAFGQVVRGMVIDGKPPAKHAQPEKMACGKTSGKSMSQLLRKPKPMRHTAEKRTPEQNSSLELRSPLVTLRTRTNELVSLFLRSVPSQ